MKAIAIFILFIGCLLIIQGYYSNKKICKKDKVIIKYVPRSVYEEQMNPQKVYKLFIKGCLMILYCPHKIFIFIPNIIKWKY